MKRILCPTDFSVHAKKALEYAVHLSNLFNAELHLLTAYHVPSSAASIIAMDKTIKHNRLLDLNELISDVTPLLTTDKPPVVTVSKGNAPAVIANYSKHHDIDLVVMGTQGNSNIKNLLFGSVTRKVAKKVNTPMLAVPMDAQFDNLKGKKLLLALDSKVVEHEEILELPKSLAIALDTKIDIFHASPVKEELPFDPFAVNYIEDQIGEIILKKSHFPLVEVNQYLDENEVGVLIMLHRQKGFIENLLLKGFSEEELGLTSTPLMILPE